MKFPEPIFPGLFTQNQQGMREFDKSLVAALGNWAMGLKGLLERGISIADNIDGVVSTFTSNAVADTEDTVAHTLGRIPIYFVTLSLDKGAIVYKGTTTFTKTNVYLKTTQASTAVKILLL